MGAAAAASGAHTAFPFPHHPPLASQPASSRSPASAHSTPPYRTTTDNDKHKTGRHVDGADGHHDAHALHDREHAQLPRQPGPRGAARLHPGALIFVNLPRRVGLFVYRGRGKGGGEGAPSRSVVLVRRDGRGCGCRDGHCIPPSSLQPNAPSQINNPPPPFPQTHPHPTHTPFHQMACKTISNLVTRAGIQDLTGLQVNTHNTQHLFILWFHLTSLCSTDTRMLESSNRRLHTPHHSAPHHTIDPTDPRIHTTPPYHTTLPTHRSNGPTHAHHTTPLYTLQGGINVQGEEQKKLDVLSNDVLKVRPSARLPSFLCRRCCRSWCVGGDRGGGRCVYVISFVPTPLTPPNPPHNNRTRCASRASWAWWRRRRRTTPCSWRRPSTPSACVRRCCVAVFFFVACISLMN